MNRIQEVQKLYPNHLDLALQIADPNHKNKYLKWIAAQLANKHTQEDVKVTVNAFHREAKRLPESDIYKYKDLKELENEIKNLELSKRQVEIFSKEMGAIKIYSDDLCTLVRMNSKVAMLYYGKASRWCVAMEKEDYWEEYSTNGNVFYVLLDKINKKKYAIQKKGLVDVTVWEENDNELDIDEWVKTHLEFETAVFSCLHDRVDPMLYRIKKRTTSRAEVLEWLPYQHKGTVNFLKHDLRGSGYYLFDTNDPISTQSIDHLTHLSLNDLQRIQEEHPVCIDEVVKFLIGHPKIKVKALRTKLGHLIPNPEVILSEEEAAFIKLKKDPSIAVQLLKSNKQNIWMKALELAPPNIILSLLPSVNKTKKSAFVRRLKMRTSYNVLIEWLAQSGMPTIPDEVWLSKAKSQFGEYSEDDDGDKKSDVYEDYDDEYDY